ncbi:unnamed protein product, partial [Iphiclides podalirius]
MAAVRKLLVLVLLICCAVVLAQRGGGSPNNKPRPGVQSAPQRHFEKRSLDHEDGDAGDFFDQPAYENAFDRPHRIRVLPGFLH